MIHGPENVCTEMVTRECWRVSRTRNVYTDRTTVKLGSDARITGKGRYRVRTFAVDAPPAPRHVKGGAGGRSFRRPPSAPELGAPLVVDSYSADPWRGGDPAGPRPLLSSPPLPAPRAPPCLLPATVAAEPEPRGSFRARLSTLADLLRASRVSPSLQASFPGGASAAGEDDGRSVPRAPPAATSSELDTWPPSPSAGVRLAPGLGSVGAREWAVGRSRPVSAAAGRGAATSRRTRRAAALGVF